MALQLKRGTDEDRQLLVLEEGEPFYVTDSETVGVNNLWIGDGVTPGGIASSSIINTNLTDLMDVNVPLPENNQLLTYVTANSRWENTSNVRIPGTLEVDGETTFYGDLNLTDLNVTGETTLADTEITGTLTVSGPATFLNTSQLNIADNIVTINSDKTTGVPSEIMGFDFLRGSSATVKFRWSESLDRFEYTTNGTTFYQLPNQNTSTTSDVVFKTVVTDELNVNGPLTVQGLTTINDYLNVENDITANSLYADIRVQAGAYDGSTVAPELQLVNPDGIFQILADSVTNKISFNWDYGPTAGSRLEFTDTDQWFNTGKLGVGTVTPAYTLDVAGTGHFTDAIIDNDLIINGNLNVNGTTTYIDTTQLLIEDNIITLNSNVTGSPTIDAGIEIERGTATDVGLKWNETSKRWQANGNDLNFNYYNLITADDLTKDVTLGANLTIEGDLRINGNDIKSSTGTTAITLNGTDVVLANDLTLTGDLRVNGQDIKNASGQTVMTLIDSGVNVTNNLIVGDVLNVSDTTNQIAINGAAAFANTFTINGSTYLNGSLSIAAGGIIKSADTDETAMIVQNGNVQFPGKIFVNEVEFDTDTLVVDSTNNRVGIGTATPAVELQVIGTIYADSISSFDNLTTNANYIDLNNEDEAIAGLAGVRVHRGSGDEATLDWDETTSSWQANRDGSNTLLKVGALDIDDTVRLNTLTLDIETGGTYDILTSTAKSMKLYIEAYRASDDNTHIFELVAMTKPEVPAVPGGDPYQPPDVLSTTYAELSNTSLISFNRLIQDYSVVWDNGMKLRMTLSGGVTLKVVTMTTR